MASDLPKGVALLADLTSNIETVRATFETLMEKVKTDNLKTASVRFDHKYLAYNIFCYIAMINV